MQIKRLVELLVENEMKMHENQDERMPVFSIIVPAYNSEDVIEVCLKSAMAQTLQDIEIIVVDDSSRDKTVEKVENLARGDNRIKLIKHATNTKAAQARIDGVHCARGEYVLFLDSDDCLKPEACRVLCAEMRSNPCDILHFESEVCCYKRLESKEYVESWLKPYYGVLYNEEIASYCFLFERYRFTIWNKLFTAKLCQSAFKGVKTIDIQHADDAMMYFLLAANATSYRGIECDPLVVYNYGLGEGGRESIDLDQFARICQSSKAADVVDSYVEQNCERNSVLKECSIKLREMLAMNCAYEWRDTLLENERENGLFCFVTSWRGASVKAIKGICGGGIIDLSLIIGKRVFCHNNESLASVPMFVVDKLTEKHSISEGGSSLEKDVYRFELLEHWPEVDFNHTYISKGDDELYHLSEIIDVAIEEQASFVIYAGKSAESLIMLSTCLQGNGIPVFAYLDKTYSKMISESFFDSVGYPLAICQCAGFFSTSDCFADWLPYNSHAIEINQSKGIINSCLSIMIEAPKESVCELEKQKALAFASTAHSFKSAFEDMSRQRLELLDTMKQDDIYCQGLQNEILGLNSSLERKEATLKRISEKNCRLKEKLDKQNNKLKESETRMNAILCSRSWVIGRSLTWFPRTIKRIVFRRAHR